MKQAPVILIALSIILAVIFVAVFYQSTVPPQTDPAVGAAAVSAPETDTALAEEEAEAPIPEATVLIPETGADAQRGINQVRVRPDGSSVFAGTAPPGSTVTLRDDDEVIGSAIATDKGEWVIVPDNRFEAGEHGITATVTQPDGSSQIEDMAVVIDIPPGNDGTPLVLLVPSDDDDSAVEVVQAPDGVNEAATTIETTTTPIAAEENGTAVLITPTVTIRNVSAPNPDSISVRGRAEGGVSVRLSVNGEPASQAPVSATGQYQLGQPISSGDAAETTTLKTTLLSENGDVLATAQLKLSRKQLEAIHSSNSLVVIEKGDALWRIAYRIYGRGIRYLDIYRQNSTIIRDADLIYPEQIFILPNS